MYTSSPVKKSVKKPQLNKHHNAMPHMIQNKLLSSCKESPHPPHQKRVTPRLQARSAPVAVRAGPPPSRSLVFRVVISSLVVMRVLASCPTTPVTLSEPKILGKPVCAICVRGLNRWVVGAVSCCHCLECTKVYRNMKVNSHHPD